MKAGQCTELWMQARGEIWYGQASGQCRVVSLLKLGRGSGVGTEGLGQRVWVTLAGTAGTAGVWEI
ncbi:hypothetical protein WG66_016294 [Moniliophthora roreri]|nr:hypothetical protein WG66_016294 [Moniliophthora roreri]